MAQGAEAAGVRVVASYPGSPGSRTVEALIESAPVRGHHVEWSANEKVAIEVGIGASIAGRRALVCAKSVGMNLMLDPLMALNLTPVHGGLVILVGDDPGGYGSQNDQDTRPLAPMLEMPWLEPSSPAEAFAMMREAFALSERLRTAVVLRETRSFTQRVERVEVPDDPPAAVELGTAREPWRFVPVPSNAVAKHHELHTRVGQFEEWSESAPYNRIEGSRRRGIVAAGFAYDKLRDVIGDVETSPFAVLKLGVLWPLPTETVTRFLAACDEVLVLEEIEPFVETAIRAIGFGQPAGATLHGKHSGHIPRAGELFRWQIQRALARFAPEFSPARAFREEDEAHERPAREGHCGACGYDRVLDALEAAAADLGRELFLVGDPGCLVTVADRLHAKFALGSAVAVVHGLIKAGIRETPVAIFGDSAFFHTAIPAICNAAHNECEMLCVVLDNRTTMTSGRQPNPATGFNAIGGAVPVLSIEALARASGVKAIDRTDVADGPSSMQRVFRSTLERRGLRMVIARTPGPGD